MEANAKKCISVLGVIALSIILLTGISLLPAMQIGVYGQQQQQQPTQQQGIGVSQIINKISTQVANTNPGTNTTQLQQLLVQLARQTAQTVGQAKTIDEIRQIDLQITTFPQGIVSKSLAHLAQKIVSGSNTGLQIAQNILKDRSAGNDVNKAIVDTAVQVSTPGT